MAGWLISNYDKRPYLNARNMNLGELCSLLVSFSVLNMDHTNIHKDIMTVINKNLENLTNQQLVQLMSVAKYISKFSRYEGNNMFNQISIPRYTKGYYSQRVS